MSTEIVPREKVTKHGVQGVISTAGGIVSFVLAAVTTGAFHWFGVIVGGIIAVAGLALSSSKHDRTLGIATTVVGAAVTVASVGLFRGLVHGVLVAGGIVLVGIGVYSLVRFFRGLKTRT
jgi:hypothetical protein